MISSPVITTCAARPYVGLRTITPFSGMFAERDKLLKELRYWVQAKNSADQGLYFLRYHVIDMNGKMDITVGFLVPAHLPGDGRVLADEFPAGTYAMLTYKRYALRANKALLGWASEHSIPLDRWDDPAGDAFACRYETYLTDYRREPRKTEWEVELAIKIKGSL